MGVMICCVGGLLQENQSGVLHGSDSQGSIRKNLEKRPKSKACNWRSSSLNSNMTHTCKNSSSLKSRGSMVLLCFPFLIGPPKGTGEHIDWIISMISLFLSFNAS
jgi:hypothetical protein